jgi:hypothetical protein
MKKIMAFSAILGLSVAFPVRAEYLLPANSPKICEAWNLNCTRKTRGEYQWEGTIYGSDKILLLKAPDSSFLKFQIIDGKNSDVKKLCTQAAKDEGIPFFSTAANQCLLMPRH